MAVDVVVVDLAAGCCCGRCSSGCCCGRCGSPLL